MDPFKYDGYYYCEGGEYGDKGWYENRPNHPYSYYFSGEADSENLKMHTIIIIPKKSIIK